MKIFKWGKKKMEDLTDEELVENMSADMLEKMNREQLHLRAISMDTAASLQMITNIIKAYHNETEEQPVDRIEYLRFLGSLKEFNNKVLNALGVLSGQVLVMRMHLYRIGLDPYPEGFLYPDKSEIKTFISQILQQDEEAVAAAHEGSKKLRETVDTLATKFQMQKLMKDISKGAL